MIKAEAEDDDDDVPEAEAVAAVEVMAETAAGLRSLVLGAQGTADSGGGGFFLA